MDKYTLLIITARGCPACENLKNSGVIKKIETLFKQKNVEVKHIDNPSMNNKLKEFIDLEKKGLLIYGFPSFVLISSDYNSKNSLKNEYLLFDIKEAGISSWSSISEFLIKWYEKNKML